MAERKKFLLRMSPSLWDALNRWAAQEFRSVNGQIEFILQRAVREKYGKEPEKENAEGDSETGGPPTTNET
jgi:hypothetical protein